MSTTAFFHRIRGPGGSLVDQGLVSLGNFVTVFLFARDLDPEHFGLVALILTCAQMLIALQTSLVGEVHNVLGPARDDLGLKSLTGSLTVTLVLLAGSVGVLGVSIGAVAGRLAPGSLVSTFPLALAAMTAPWMVQDGIRRMLYTDRRMGSILATDLVSYGLMAAGAIGMTVGVLPMTFNAAVWVVFVSSGLGAVVALLAVRRAGARFDRTRWLDDLRETWHLARYLVSGEALRTVQGNVTTWIVAGAVGLPALGAYRAAVQIVNAMNPLQQAVSLYWPSMAASRWARQPIESYKAWFARNSVIVVALYGILALTLAAFARPILDLAYGDRYAAYPMAALVVISVIGRIFVVGRSVVHIGLVAARQPKIMVIDSIAESALLVVIGVPLIVSFGVVGAAMWHAVVALLLGGYAWFVFHRLGSEFGERGRNNPASLTARESGIRA